MPTKVSDKCRQCSKLSVEDAIALHGESGDGCWVGEPCHKKRTYYKKRDLYNRNRRLKYRGDKESAAQLIDIPTIPAVVVYFFRQRKDEPLHAMAVELWIGQQKKAVHEPVHTLGWTGAHVKEYIKGAIAEFNQQYAVNISGIAATVELNPSLCPLNPCPLKLDGKKTDGYCI